MNFEKLKSDLQEKYLQEHPVYDVRPESEFEEIFRDDKIQIIGIICDVLAEYDKRKQEEV